MGQDRGIFLVEPHEHTAGAVLAESEVTAENGKEFVWLLSLTFKQISKARAFHVASSPFFEAILDKNIRHSSPEFLFSPVSFVEFIETLFSIADTGASSNSGASAPSTHLQTPKPRGANRPDCPTDANHPCSDTRGISSPYCANPPVPISCESNSFDRTCSHHKLHACVSCPCITNAYIHSDATSY